MLKAGCATADLTPARDADLIGYEFRAERLGNGNDGVLDPLRARVLVMRDEGGALALASLDLCILDVPSARRLRHAIAERLELAPARVLVACSHTHSGPWPVLDAAGAAAGTACADGVIPADAANAAYGRRVQDAVVRAAAAAAGLLVPVTAHALEAPLGLAYDRRVPMPGGVRHCWNPQEYPDLRPAPARDPACAALLLRQTNGPREFVVWNFGAHPVCLGKTSRVVSADWPGAAAAAIEAGGPARHALFTLGACGDAQPWIATQECADGPRRVGAAAGAFVNVLLDAARPCAVTPWRASERTVALGGVELDLTLWQRGDLRVVAMPVELFGALGAALRRRLGGTVLLATNANGWTGYWPDADAFAAGGYEINAAREAGRRPGDGERLLDVVVEMAQAAAL